MSRTSGSWPKGKSGNPGGRPKVLGAVQALARRHTVEAIGELVRLMRDGETDHVKLAAVKELLARAWGQPVQPIEGTSEDGGITVVIRQFADADDAPRSERDFRADPADSPHAGVGAISPMEMHKHLAGPVRN
jgi:hypothetical protein